ncbi:hypothetical protein ACTWWB_000364 [Vibrio fluvialis]|uniref:hypothetical protein n=1 Tax=Vibrio fluvialis TaxID=676 RepID=UPI001BAEF715|nr:hypothetical protein [Vibrio fluvialis]EKO3498264.1 hypothetical protein [Vibrio fluvialis]EKO3968023.1 hypothetical protein [Vibrio fluvialis]EKZ8999311.1 hypothetical protein [Vibrio fluvialis]ELI1828042.1 hypothetical protein [Vibrio fluvialis]QUF70419.1 hypothetical protein KC397_19000 [Vibrio fluvialis]
MKKIEASVQHVSIFRIGDVYLIGVLYDFESDNQEESLDIVVQGNSISFWIDKAEGPKKQRTSMTSVTVHILSVAGPIPMFKVSKNKDTIINIPVFSLKGKDQLKISGELTSISSTMRQTLSVVPKSKAGLPKDILEELGVEDKNAIAAREWGWRGW